MTKNTAVNTSGFIMLPRELLSARFAELSLHARVLYSLLLDRNELSEKNGMNDDCGKIVVFFPVEEVCERLGCGHGKTTRIFHELEQFGLIKRKFQGLGKSAMIYVNSLPECENKSEQADEQQAPNANTTHKVESRNSEQYETSSPDIQKSALQTTQNRQSRQPEIGSLDSPKSETIYTERNYTEKNYQENIYPQSISYDDAIDEIAHQIEYDVLSERGYGGMLDEIVGLIADTLCANAPSVRIAGRQIPVETIRSRFSRLSAEHIEQVIRSLECNAVNVRNMRAYLLTAIYNSVDALEILSFEGCADAFRKQRSSGNYYGESKKPTHFYADRFVI